LLSGEFGAAGLGSERLRAQRAVTDVVPGVWTGRGLAAVGLPAGDVVSERRAELLLGEGRHPDADRIEHELLESRVIAGRCRCCEYLPAME
jgi:hypothetical protein